MRRGFAPDFVEYKKGCIRLTAASDTVYQLLAHGRWFSPGTPASSTTTTGHHAVPEILIKVALSTQKSINQWCPTYIVLCFSYVCIRLVYRMLPVSLDCLFFITPSLFSNVYLKRMVE